MRLEVALIQWNDQGEAVRLLGRSGDAELVEVVRQHLVQRFAPAQSGELPLRLLPEPKDDGGTS